MLRRLHIRNYVLIDSLDIDFPEGLVIITGQTGAGKSILLGSLALVAGARADAREILHGSENCVVEAEYEVGQDDEAVRDIVLGNDIEWDGGHLTVRRVVSASGRSRCFVNDSPVPVAVLEELSSRLVDIHSQHQSLLLTDRRFQLSILDHYAGNAGLLARCSASWKALLAARNELDEAAEKLERLSSDRDYNEARFRQLDSARLRPGELEELEAEHRELANAGQIKESLALASSGLESLSSLKEARKALEHIAGLVPAAGELASRIESSRIELDDIASEISLVDSRIGLSADKLGSVEERMSTLYGLLKKFDCNSVEDLIEVRDRLAEGLEDTGTLRERIAELADIAAGKQEEYDAVCSSLAESRRKAAPGFAGEICKSLKYLELERAVFVADVLDSQPGPGGKDSVLLRFSASGADPIDVAKCASGGEISRIMLCLKAMMAKFTGMPTLIFDEIDTGVSGAVADKMGSMICSMGRDMQVLSITHLPQVAAKGDAHYVVSKEYDGDAAVTRIRKVTGEERITEIARLLSGATITPEAVANAKSLLDAK